MKTVFLCLALSATAMASTSQGPNVGVRRFAVLIGANEGGRGRVPLRYARSDVGAMAEVLETIGGVNPVDRTLLLDPDRAALEGALASLHARLTQLVRSGERTEVLLYYSGHSDEDGLLLWGQRYAYRDLRRALDELPADVRIAVLDSCASGAMTRGKGGVARPSFLVDASSQVKGYAFLTAASDTESAQESDRIGGSFFTHFLVSGLRGGADSSRDGKVTLIEAYQFAFQETLARTERTRGGAQHPTYDIQLAGSGDLVLSDLRTPSSKLVIGPAVKGRLFVRTREGQLTVELPKLAGSELEVALAPGRYRITLEDESKVSEAELSLAPGARGQLEVSGLRDVALEATVSRGGAGRPPEVYRRRPFNASLVPGIDTNPRDVEVMNHLSVGLMGTRADRLEGVALSLVGNAVKDDASGLMVGLVGNDVGKEMTGVQLGLVGNRAGALRGMQVAFGLNVSAGATGVMQLALGMNYARAEVLGLQGAMGLNWTQGPVTGLQLALVLNRAGSVRGIQGTLGLNYSETDVSFVQLAGVGNWSAGEVRGLQAALGFNHAAGPVQGLQVAALNDAVQVRGGQVGLLNVGRKVEGLQLGLINVADEVDAPIGVINVVRQGRQNLAVFFGETHRVNAQLKYGGRYVYSFLGAGWAPRRSESAARYGLGFGLGGHIPLDRFFVDIELSALNLHYTDVPFWLEGPNALVTLRSVVGLQVARRLAIIAGPSLNLFASMGRDRGDVGRGLGAALDDGAGFPVRIFPGFALGIQL